MSQVIFTGYNGEREGALDRLRATQMVLPYSYRDLKEMPEIIDPAILDANLTPVEDQGNMGSCFAAGVPISMADGTKKPIETVVVGDVVVDRWGGAQNVTHTMRRVFDGTMVTVKPYGSAPLEMTACHVVFVKRNNLEIEVKAGDIELTDLVKLHSVSSAVIDPNNHVELVNSGVWTRIEQISKREVLGLDVFDFTVENTHSFVAENIVVHNCQGNALTECVEYCYYVATKRVVQLSRLFGYLGSQRYDNIMGDQGSTLEGGTKLVETDGICLESTVPYPSAYPNGGWKVLSDAAWSEAKNARMAKHTVIESWDQAITFLASGLGIIQIGIMWGNGMTPGSNGIIDTTNIAGGGGHSVVFNGYAPDRVVGVSSPDGRWLRLKNSWSRRWGVNGVAWVSRRTFEAMLRAKWTVMLGRTECITPNPRPVPSDFLDPKKWRYA